MTNTKRLNILAELEYQKHEACIATGHTLGKGFTVEGIYLQGSQNYGTDHENSDVDSKMVIVPTIDSLLRGKKFSSEITLQGNVKVSVKTFPEYAELFFKGNVNNLEMLFTPYYTGGVLVDQVKPSREDIVQSVKRTMLDAAVGMMMQKRKSLLSGTVTTQPFVNVHGYDNKDAIHILRLGNLVRRTILGEKFEDVLIVEPEIKPFMLQLRNGEFDSEFVQNWSDKLIADTKQRVDESGIKNDMERVSVLRKRVEDIYVEWYKECMY